MTDTPNTDQLDLDAIESRHKADDAKEGEDTGSFSVPMDSQGWATGPAVSYNPLPPIDGERAHADRAALLAEVRKLREALAPFAEYAAFAQSDKYPEDAQGMAVLGRVVDHTRTPPAEMVIRMADLHRALEALKAKEGGA